VDPFSSTNESICFGVLFAAHTMLAASRPVRGTRMFQCLYFYVIGRRVIRNWWLLQIHDP
jgi:hypothetical protein